MPSNRVSELAHRLAELNPVDREGEGLMSVAIGVMYALHSALAQDYSDADGTAFSHVRKAAEALARGQTPQTQKYLAGYYFNDALLRLDIAYENAASPPDKTKG
jgi:hypothetical protein